MRQTSFVTTELGKKFPEGDAGLNCLRFHTPNLC
jgi:hypothetical protein